MAEWVSNICVNLHDQETWPVAWKGGRQFDLWKGKGRSVGAEKYRSILLAFMVGKAMARL